MSKTRGRNSRRTDRRIKVDLTASEYNYIREFKDQVDEILRRVKTEDYEELSMIVAELTILHFRIGAQYAAEQHAFKYMRNFSLKKR